MPSTQNYGPTNTALPVLQTVTGTAEAMVLSANPNALASVPTALQGSQALSAGAPTVLTTTIPANSALAGKRFGFLTAFAIAAAASENVTVKLYAAKVALSTTPGSNTLLGSSGAIASGGATTLVGWAEFQGVYDAVSGILTGTVSFYIGGTLVATVATSNAITGVSETANPILNFGLSVTFSVAEASGNTIAIVEGGTGVTF